MTLFRPLTTEFTRSGVLAGAAAAVMLWSAVPAAAHSDQELADLIEETAPSVVTILASSTSTAALNQGMEQNGKSPFEEFFRQFGMPEEFKGNPERFGREGPRQGLGSGFIFDEEGLIVTNHHVVVDADKVTVRLSDQREFEAEVIGMDKQTDLAVLRIDAEETLPFVEFGDSDVLRVGETVFAVGNPFGLGGTVTTGIVSAKGRDIATGPYADFIQTDAAINRGNSGGPLFNMEGDVVGVNSAIYSPNGGSVGLGFAVASAIAEDVIDDLMTDGEVSRGWLGVSIQDVTPDIADAMGLDTPQGALVASVVEGSPSEGTLESGDVILGFGGDDVTSSRDLPKLVAATKSGTEVDVRVFRDGATKNLSIAIGTLDTEQLASLDADETTDAPSEKLGASVAGLTDDARGALGLDEGVEGVVITSVEDDGAAREAGLQEGDVIVKLGNEPVATPAALDKALEESEKDRELMLINRGGNQIFVALKLA